jgi:hypothetical protein
MCVCCQKTANKRSGVTKHNRVSSSRDIAALGVVD